MTADRPGVELLFLWHHHQPDYRSPRTGVALLPWVRLHAVKDYLDMALHLERHAGVRATFNFVPALVDQLEDAVAGKGDALFDLLRRPVADLAPEEREAIAFRCTQCPPRTRERWPEYAALRRRAVRAHEDRGAPLDDRELASLEAWFLYSWLDPTSWGEPEAVALLAARQAPGGKERDALLDLIARLLARVLPAYRALAARGQIELSTSPSSTRRSRAGRVPTSTCPRRASPRPRTRRARSSVRSRATPKSSVLRRAASGRRRAR